MTITKRRQIKHKVQNFLVLVLSVVMVLSLLPAAVAFPEESAVQTEEASSEYFYNQLNERGKAIYDKLLEAFTGEEKETYYSGTKIIDLMNLRDKNGNEVIGQKEVEAYKKGNKDIFNDFAAAKDALDLDHSELWYLDSGYFTFQVTEENSTYHVLVGPGRGDTYLLAGKEITDLKDKIAETDKAVDAITAEARRALEEAEKQAGTEFSEQDKKATLITSVHDQIIKKIHYRYETECRTVDGTANANARYIRTLYGIVTHEGVCEAYARTLQVCLKKLGVECVLIHGVQTKGTPEDHMWNAVNIPENGKDHWYVVDATWDDPLTANWDGTRDLTFANGLDGKETNTYLMVGQSLVGEYWRPSGYVSTGNFEFQYPTIETASYSGTVAYGGDDGLKVQYSTGSSQEDGVPAGVYTATYRGMNAEEAAKHGLFFMLKMYDYHPDGTSDVMDEWYYVNATLLLSSKNPYFGDYADGLRFSSATCEYVEIAVTTRKPDHFEEWSTNPETSYLSRNYEAGYFHGEESEIIAQSGMLYNVNSKYEAPPYVLTQTPAPNGNATAGYEYRFKVTFDDDLYHILPEDENARSGIASVADVNFFDNYEEAKKQTVQVRYTTNQQDLHNGGAVVQTQVSGELPFDKDRDGVVDMEAGSAADLKWIYKSDPVEAGGHGVECPNHAYHTESGKACSVEDGCPIVGVEFNFRASDQWIDDITEYNFSIDGVVGSRSGKYANNFSVIAMVPGLCPACYRSQGIDWNLWGQPTLLDAPENLDLHAMAEAGGTDKDTLEALDAEINKSGLNGRLMLVVENKSKGAGSREEYEKIDGFLEESGQLNGTVLSSSVFEINFNRLCPMVKLKPNQGQSLRVQVGYPAGITYEDLGSGKVELKAYHFTRCAENEPCEEYKKELENAKTKAAKDDVKRTHQWGSHIISVNEITIVPTPYGMVIMCDAFSPFEIVAIQKTDQTTKAASADKTVVVVSDMNGTVEYQKGSETVPAIGADGNVKFTADETKTFTVKPKTGYAVDTVSLDGKAISVTDGKFTVEKPEDGAVLNVTFLPETVQAEKKKANYGATVVASVCTHKSVVTVSEPGHTEDVEPTCTTDGYALGTECAVCGQTLTEGHVIPATGHTIDKTNAAYYKEGKAPACETAGTRDFVKCTVCNTVLSDQEELPALGHIFMEYEDGEETCQGREMTATCERCSKTETKMDPSGKVDHKYKLKESKPATCETDAADILQCEWCGDIVEEVKEGTKTGHKPDKTGVCTECGKFLCEAGHTYVETKAADPTCTEFGHTAGIVCSICGTWKVPEQLIAPIGHDWDGHMKGAHCRRCGAEMLSDEHTPVPMEEVPATCDQDGWTGGVHCSECGDIIEPPTKVPKKGHDWDTGTAEWKWSAEGGTVSATVILTCKNDPDHLEAFAAELGKPEIEKEAGCTEEGLAVYTATLTITCSAGEKTISSDPHKVILPPEHKFGDAVITLATCIRLAEKTYECSVCHIRKSEIDEAGGYAEHAFVIDTIKSVPAGCTAAGTTVRVCEVCRHEESETVPAAGHSWAAEPAEWKWSEDCRFCDVTVICEKCEDTKVIAAEVSPNPVKAPTCTEAGETVYTAAVVLNGKTYTAESKAVPSEALGHSAKKVNAKEPSETEAGNIEYWYCSVCEKYFKDEALTQEIQKEDTVIAAAGTKDPTEPTEPTDPTDPTEPTKPTEPTDPTEPTQPTDQTGSAKPTGPDTPQTADNSHVVLWLMLLGVSALVMGITFRKRTYRSF